MVRFTLHVPLQRNDGTPITSTELETIEAELLTITDGYTAWPSVGAWRGPDGTIYREAIQLYAFDLPPAAITHRKERIESLAEFVATGLEQEAVYLTAHEISALLVTPAELVAP